MSDDGPIAVRNFGDKLADELEGLAELATALAPKARNTHFDLHERDSYKRDVTFMQHELRRMLKEIGG